MSGVGNANPVTCITFHRTKSPNLDPGFQVGQGYFLSAGVIPILGCP